MADASRALNTDPPALRIGEAAQRTGLSVKAIRFYCDQGLIQPGSRSAGGYRLFDEASLKELVLVRTLRAMDVPIAELSRILEVRRTGICNCSSLKGGLAAKLASIDQRIVELIEMKTELQRLLDGWQDCGGQRPEGPPAQS